ncbi:MAG: hypothetical protein ACEY3M_13370 [Wolbachia sp.]
MPRHWDPGILIGHWVGKHKSVMLKHNVLDGIIWKTRSQCLGTGMTKESSVKHWNDTLYGLLNYNYKCLRNLPNKKKGKRSPGVIIRFKILAFFMF